MDAITDISQLDLSKSYTYADYLSWKFTDLVELVRGRIVRKVSGPVTAHQRCSINLGRIIDTSLVGQTCQVFAVPFDVRLWRSTGNGDDQIWTVVQPDLCIICDPAKIDRRGCLGAPDWVIEIISSRTAVYDTKTKFDLYAENGVTEYWLVFPGEQSINTFVLRDGEYQPTGVYDEPGLIPSQTLPSLQVEWASVLTGVA